ncbi:MAG: Methyltransferase domain protein [Candidatus Argoarchaeum ethanivorans]|uniref:Methyltransferase domain protein n=1 Tax=Candidatus Argoarchaeum ethanivorans TaxID=2608793 RepID=A0A811T9A1_9EURY|nr:MAG: Methyltransferase domain protein [Candidatus Argoarchaeum ethanivorans]
MKRIWQIIDEMVWKYSAYVPFYLTNTILRSLNKGSENILELACGRGETMKILQSNKHKFYSVGADIFESDLKEAKRNKTHDEYVLCDVRKLPFKENSFDIVLCMELIEHFERENGMKLIEEMEKIAKKQVIITTPVGFLQQDPCDGNPHQEHKSGYYPFEFKKVGYNVSGFGVKISWWLTPSHSYLKKIIKRVLRVIFSPFSYYFPNLGERMICIKNIDASSDEKFSSASL